MSEETPTSTVKRGRRRLLNGRQSQRNYRQEGLENRSFNEETTQFTFGPVLDVKDFIELSGNGSLSRERELNNSFYLRSDKSSHDFTSYDSDEKGSFTKTTAIAFEQTQLSETQHSPGDSIPSSRRGRVIEFYKKYGDFWNIFPKTDYTYSPLSPWYNKEIAPGIPIIPNMTRPPVHQPRVGALSFASSKFDLQSIKDNSRHSSSSFHHEYRRSWVEIVRTTITTTVTTVTTTVSHVTSTVIGPSEGRSWSRLLLFLFLLLALLLSYPLFQEVIHNQKSDDFFNFPGYLVNFAYGRFVWLNDISTWFGNLLVDSVRMTPLFLGQLFNASYYLAISPADVIHFRSFDHPTAVPAQPVISPAGSDYNLTRLINEIMEVRDVLKSLESRIDSNDVITEGVLKSVQESVQLKMDEIRKDIDFKLSNHDEQIETVKGLVTTANSNFHSEITFGSDMWSQFEQYVETLLHKYHADQTGKPDFALSSNGGMIISIRCTQPYKKDNPELYLLGFRMWSWNQSPELIIQPGVMPGQCWPFEGSEGYVVIKLAVPIFIESFTLEHTPKELTLYKNIKSAPKKFSVWGLRELTDTDSVLLGKFQFADNGRSLQTFEAINVGKPFEMIELQIESNHGHLDYTCVYRFRVHGQPVSQETID